MVVALCQQNEKDMNTQTVSTLTVGQVINFNRSTTADDSNYVVLGHYSDKFGNWTKIMKISEHNEPVTEFIQESIAQHTEIGNFWTLIA